MDDGLAEETPGADARSVRSGIGARRVNRCVRQQALVGAPASLIDREVDADLVDEDAEYAIHEHRDEVAVDRDHNGPIRGDETIDSGPRHGVCVRLGEHVHPLAVLG